MKQAAALPIALFFLFVSAAFISGCSTAGLMPSDSSVSVGGVGNWTNYEDAMKFYNSIEPYKTTFEEMKKLGFDPKSSKNVLEIGPTVLRDRFMKNPSMKTEDLPVGVQDCFRNSESCRGYEIWKNDRQKKGQGSIFLRWLNFKKENMVSGWTVKLLVLVKDGTVVYKEPLEGTPGGTGNLEIEKNPLGPLQEPFELMKKYAPRP